MISRPRACTLDIHKRLAERHQRPKQDMDVIRHDYPREKLVKPPLCHAR